MQAEVVSNRNHNQTGILERERERNTHQTHQTITLLLTTVNMVNDLWYRLDHLVQIHNFRRLMFR